MKSINLANGIEFNVEESADVDFTIGTELTLCGITVKEKGYGRQGLYLHFEELPDNHYYRDVFPNVEEHYNLEEDDSRSTVSKLAEFLNGENITIFIERDEDE